jgi:hypothetical protein
LKKREIEPPFIPDNSLINNIIMKKDKENTERFINKFESIDDQ